MEKKCVGIYQRGNGRWYGQFGWKGKLYYVGSFDTFEEAKIAKEKREKELSVVRPQPGVTKYKNKFRAQIHKNGKRINLGYFATYEEALAARKLGEKRLSKEKDHNRAYRKKVKRRQVYEQTLMDKMYTGVFNPILDSRETALAYYKPWAAAGKKYNLSLELIQKIRCSYNSGGITIANLVKEHGIKKSIMYQILKN